MITYLLPINIFVFRHLWCLRFHIKHSQTAQNIKFFRLYHICIIYIGILPPLGKGIICARNNQIGIGKAIYHTHNVYQYPYIAATHMFVRVDVLMWVSRAIPRISKLDKCCLSHWRGETMQRNENIHINPFWINQKQQTTPELLKRFAWVGRLMHVPMWMHANVYKFFFNHHTDCSLHFYWDHHLYSRW